MNIYLKVSEGTLPKHLGGISHLTIEIESMAISPLQEIPRVPSNSRVNGDLRRPIETYVVYHWFPWLPKNKKNI